MFTPFANAQLYNFTVKFMPSHLDLVSRMQTEANKNNFTSLNNRITIDMLQKDDLVIVGLNGKVQGGLM